MQNLLANIRNAPASKHSPCPLVVYHFSTVILEQEPMVLLIFLIHVYPQKHLRDITPETHLVFPKPEQNLQVIQQEIGSRESFLVQ